LLRPLGRFDAGQIHRPLALRISCVRGSRFAVAVISIDPTHRRTGGALLGDRVRMNAIAPWESGPRVYMRSLATR